MKPLGEVLVTFRAAVSSSWPSVWALFSEVRADAAEGLVSDWLQSMWEMLVEASLTEGRSMLFLEAYGEGADCNPRSSRVYRPEALPTHAIHCVPAIGASFWDVLTKTQVLAPEPGLAMDRFVRLATSGWYEYGPPFDHVLLYNAGNEVVVKVDDVRFVLRPNGE